MEASKIIAKARTHLMLRQPFFGSIALSLTMEETDEIPSMATDGKSIKYNPKFVQMHKIEEIEGVIAHEAMHVALKHMLRRGDFDRQLWNMATDYAINLIVVDSGLKIPECGLLEREYQGMSAEAIYNRLLQDPPEPESQDWNFGGVEEAKGEDGQGLSESEASALEGEVDVMVLRAHSTAKAMGKVPAGIDGLITEISAPKVDWRDKLRTFIGGDQPDDYSWRRPNRKFYGTYGVYMPSVDHYGAGHVVVGVDTSGSVSDAELAQFLGELSAIAEDMCPASVTVIGCDSKVQSVTQYEQGEPIDKLNSTGRGGTRVSPVFDHIKEQGLPVDSFIYFTDLYVWDFPLEPDFPVLWVSTGSPDAPWGEVVNAKL